MEEILYLVIGDGFNRGLPHFMEVGSIVIGATIEDDEQHGHWVRSTNDQGFYQWIQEKDLFKIGYL